MVGRELYSYLCVLALLKTHTSCEAFPGRRDTCSGREGKGMHSETQELKPHLLQR